MSLVAVQSPDEVNQQEEDKATRRAALDAAQSSPVITGLAAHVTRRWESARSYKETNIVPRLEECHRRRSGKYSTQKLQEIREFGGSEVWMNLTNVKARAIESWLRDILVCEEKPWGVEPTPIADMPPDIKQSVLGKLQQDTLALYQQFQGQVPPDMIQERARRMYEDAMVVLQEEAEARARNMEQKIEDQLTDGGWDSALYEFLYDMATYPVATLKAPVMHVRKKLSWGAGRRRADDTRCLFRCSA